MKREAIKKVFGAKSHAKYTPLTGGIGTVVAIIDGLTKYNWEAAWPAMQKAMIGLGVAAIATIQGEAIRKGLSELAERIAAFQPIASPMPGEPLTWAEAMPLPHIPLPPLEITSFQESMVPLLVRALLNETYSESPMFPQKNICEFLTRHLANAEADLDIPWAKISIVGQTVGVAVAVKAIRIVMNLLGC